MEHAPPWLVNSFIYLAASVLAVTLSRAVGLGAIIGYLVAGIVIGPWGLGLIANVQDILHFAEFGVVLMLFLVGLELEPRRLWSLRRPIFGWGSVQVLACALAITAAALALGVAWRTALVAGLGLALSSTAIALQVMDERNLMRTSTGQAGFSILLFQDVAAIPILALLPLLGVAARAEALQPHAPLDLLPEALKIIAVVAAIVFGGRWVLRPLLRWIAKSKTPEIFTAASLFLVVGIAMLMLTVGLSMALGAFLAGVLLADSEYRRELETDIEPFKGLLLGLFFIAVGMSIDFGVLLRSPWLVAWMALMWSLCAVGVLGWWRARSRSLRVAKPSMLWRATRHAAALSFLWGLLPALWFAQLPAAHQLLLAVRFLQPQVHAHGMHRQVVARRLQNAMQHAAPLRPPDGDVVVFVMRDGKLRQQGVAVVAVVIHRIAPVGVLRPDRVGQKFVMRHLRKIGHALRMALVAALHLLQKHQVCRHAAHGLAQLVQHEAPVEGGEALVHVHGEHLERNRLRVCCGVRGHGQLQSLEGAPAKSPHRCGRASPDCSGPSALPL